MRKTKKSGKSRGIKQLDYFFSPKNVAVIGASNESDSIGKAIFENFLSGSLRSKTYAVNPFHKKILGKRSYASVKDIPVDLDLAVIVVPAKIVPNVLTECVDKKVEAVIIISAGFSEIGEKKLAAEVQGIIDKNPKTRVLGPNCFGILMPKAELDTTFSEHQKMKMPKAGTVAFMSQSGALGVAILDWASTQEFGISKFISYGNAMDIDEADLLEYLAQDKDTKVITAYLEGVKEGRKFLKIGKKTSVKKPIVVLKGGVTKEAHAATISHTGSMAGSVEVYHALFKQTGMIQANSLLELFSFAKTLENEPLPKGNRVQIITNGGGYGIVTADAVVKNNLRLAKMESGNVKKLKKVFPRTVSFGNPMDLVGDADDKRYAIAARTALNDKNVDILMILILFNTPAIDKDIVKELAKIRKGAKKPVVIVSIGSDYTEKRKKELEKEGFIAFSYPAVATRALEALYNYSEFRRRNH